MGLLLRVSQEGQLLTWVRVHTGTLHGPGKDSAGNRNPSFRCSLMQHSFRTIVGCSLFPVLSFQCVHLQVVTFFHTVLLSDNLKFRTALVVCPLNTVLNWVCEFRKWQRNLESNRVKVGTNSSLYPGGAFQTQTRHECCVAGSTSGDGKASPRPSQCSAELVPRGRGYGNGVRPVPNPVTGPEVQR